VTQIQYVAGRGDSIAEQVYAQDHSPADLLFQTNPTGRLLSTTINDVERTRIALSEYLADLFKKAHADCVLSGCRVLNWRWRWERPFVPLVVVPVGKLGKKFAASSEIARAVLGPQPDIAGGR